MDILFTLDLLFIALELPAEADFLLWVSSSAWISWYNSVNFLQHFTTFYNILQHFPTFYYILLHFTTFYYILLHFTSFYFILLHFTTFYYILLHFTTFYYILLHFTTFYYIFQAAFYRMHADEDGNQVKHNPEHHGYNLHAEGTDNSIQKIMVIICM